ncbi:hypothetical protein B9Z19DRAFT_981451, partial [Tuber borchii]
LLSTSNECKNFIIIAWLLEKTFVEYYYAGSSLSSLNDAPPDSTQEVENQFITLYWANRVLKPPTGKLGLGTVYVHGLQFAMGTFVIIMDTDLLHHVISNSNGKY